MSDNNCDNCGREHGPLDECLIGVLAGVLSDRGHTITPEMIAEVDVDAFWTHHLGETIDGLAFYMDLTPYPED